MAPKLLVVFSVSHKDIDQAIQVAHWVAKLGGCPGFEALLFFGFLTPSDKKQALEKFHLANFDKVYTHTCRDEVDRPWPLPGNHMFKRTLQLVSKEYKDKGFTHFLFLEPDCLPAKTNWLSLLYEDFRKAGKHFYGPRCLAGGKHPHINGASIYPINAQKVTERFIISGSNPFDVYAGAITLPLSAPAPENTWVMQFRSFDFTGSFDSWTGRVEKRDGSVKEISGSFTESLLIHHGCKDNSLLTLFQNHIFPPKKEVPAAVEPEPVIPPNLNPEFIPFVRKRRARRKKGFVPCNS